MAERSLIGAIRTLVIGLGVVWSAFPIFMVVMSSFKTHVEIFTVPPTFIFRPTIENYLTLFRDWPQFVDDVAHGRPFVPRIEQAAKTDMSKLPQPRYDLVDHRKYLSASVQFSRGCPFMCEFCDIIIMNGRIPRTKTHDQTIREFQALYDAGWRGSVFVVDDNFIGNRVNVKQMLPQLAE